MGAKSTVKADPIIRKAVDEALARGNCTIDDIKAQIDAMGGDISRSAIGRYAKTYGQLAERSRDIKAVADSFAADFGGENDNQSRLLVQTMTTLITQALLPQLTGEPGKYDPMGMHFASSAVKNVVAAAKMEDDRRRAIRKDALSEAATAAVTAAKRAGASPETINMIRAEIMGIEA